MIGKLQDELSLMISDHEWCPKVKHRDSTMNFIEVKALLLNTKKKLTKIAKQEGYIKANNGEHKNPMEDKND